MIFSILGFILVVVLVIGIHEFGHLITARCVGVKVLRFSLGFGKTIFSYQTTSGMQFRIGIIPLGGYVKMLDEREMPVPEALLAQAYNRKAVWQRFLIVIAGPISNLLLATIVFWLMFVIGFTRPIPVIESVIPDSPIAMAGVPNQQEVIAIDGRQTADWITAAIAIVMRIGESGKLRISTRDAQSSQPVRHFNVDLKDWKIDSLKPDPLKSLGIIPQFPDDPKTILRQQQFGVFAAVVPALKKFSDYSVLHFKLFSKLVTGKISLKVLGGPISLFNFAGMALERGLVIFLGMLAVVSITIAYVNLLPFPGLDGGHLLYLLIEKLTGKPVSVAIQVLAFRIAIIFLIVFLIQLTIYDLMRL